MNNIKSKVILSNLTILIIFIITLFLIVGIVRYVKTQKVEEPLQSIIGHHFQNEEYSLSFNYPSTIGNIREEKGEYICPEDDTYMTGDTLVVYDKEFKFDQKNLPNSESFLLSGIRVHRLGPGNLNDCGDKFLQNLSRMNGEPEMLSSIRLQNFTVGNLDGAYNEEASRLNTASRRQYTLFSKSEDGRDYVIQIYGIFVPYYGSPELQEMENKYKGDMGLYISEGETSAPIREYFNEIEQIAKTIIFNQQ